jgi:hypothetical protein
VTCSCSREQLPNWFLRAWRREKPPTAFEDLGEQTLKNIARPLQVCRVRIAGGAKYASQPSLALPLPDKPSIAAVLPFANMSGDPEQEYFATAWSRK